MSLPLEREPRTAWYFAFAAVAVVLGKWVKAPHDKLAARYGSKGAKVILAAMILLAPTPVPGSSLIPIALAEAVLRISRAVTG